MKAYGRQDITLNQYEARLQAVNPKLRIKRVRMGMANVMLGTRQVCRIDSGELTLYNQFIYRAGQADQYMSDFNPKGHYMYKFMIKRGRAELARVLYTSGVIHFNQISQLS